MSSPTIAADRTLAGFVHRFEPGTGRPLLLLHGTGGDENDLIELGQRLAPGAPLLSPRGRVLEHGQPRFFRRLAEGVFDADSIRSEAAALAAFVAAAREQYGLAAPIAVGFSNGANIAAALLLLHPATLAGAVLLRARSPLEPTAAPDLGGVPVLLLSGTDDPFAPKVARDRLAAQLKAAGANLDHVVLPGGHGLTALDLNRATAWLAAHQ